MAQVLTSAGSIETLADLLDQLGGIAPERVRVPPPPGTATEKDVLKVHARQGRLCELVDGVLVEKGIGFLESVLASARIEVLQGFVKPRNLGLVAGEAGMMRLAPGLIRIPDVAFISWERLPGQRMPREAIPDLAPDLVVEMLSTSNTEAEMARKRREYFAAGARLVWVVDPVARTVEVYMTPDQAIVRHEDEILDGGAVLPEFTLPLQDLFGELDRHGGG